MLKTIVKGLQTAIGSSSPPNQSSLEPISQWEIKPSNHLIFDSGPGDITRYFQALDYLQKSPNNNQNLISLAMDRLSNDFFALLRRLTQSQAAAVAPLISTAESTSITDSTGHIFRYEDYVIPKPPNDDMIAYMRKIAEIISSSGKEYIQERRNYLRLHLEQFGFEEHRISEALPFDALKMKMEIWAENAKICIRILFEREKYLCEKIFGYNKDLQDKCFTGVVGGIALDLFRFAQGISLRKHHPYHGMDGVLALYSCFILLKPEADALFITNRGQMIRNLCRETLSHIENEIETVLRDLENDVAHEKYEVPDDNGEVLQLTEYVMHQITLIAKNGNELSSLIKKGPARNTVDFDIPEDGSFLDHHLIFIIAILQGNLKSKSESYKKATSGMLFMMNNLHYMIKSIEETNELQERIGSCYLEKLNQNFNLTTRIYLSSTCSKLMNCFDEKTVHRGVWFKTWSSKQAARSKIKAFNSAFEEIQSPNHNYNPIWTIRDSQLRARVCSLMHDTLVAAYKKFVDNLEENEELRLVLQQNVKYPPEILQELISERFSLPS